MTCPKLNFLEILKKTTVANSLERYKSYSLNWYYQRYLDKIVKSIRENETHQASDKLLQKLTRFYLDNEKNCDLLAKTYEEIRRGYFLYKISKLRKETN